MAFSNFTFPQVLKDLGLNKREADLFSQIPAITPRAEFVETVNQGALIALPMGVEKAKSEFIIAPILLELRRLLGGAMGLFSGIELNVDAAKGLNGVCDFILTKEPSQFDLRAPLITIVEAKNDNLRSGLGQCIAAAFAAELFNQQAGLAAKPVFGVVTIGSAWQFLRLEGTLVILELGEYYISNLGKILGVLKHIIETA